MNSIHFPKLLESSPDGFCVCHDGIIDYINPAGIRIFGFPDRASVQGKEFADFLHPDYQVLCEENFSALMDEAAATPMKIARPSGEFLDVRVSAQRNPDEPLEIVISIRDISDFMRATREVATQVKRLNNILDTAVDAIIVCDEKGSIQTFNRAAAAMFGVSSGDMIGQPLDSLFIHAGELADHAALDLAEHPYLAVGRGHEVTARRKDGSSFPAEMSLSVCQLDRQRLFTAMVRDITERRFFENNLSHSATHDALTSLPNRTLLQDRLDRMMFEGVPAGHLLSVWFIDLGGLKVVNDVMGHDAGDELLIMAGKRILDSVSEGDLVARFGGDEFAIIRAGFSNGNDVVKGAEAFVAAMTNRPFILHGREVTINITVGIAIHSGEADQPTDLLLDASAAMTFAKSGGRNQFRFFEPAMHRESAERLMLENELRRGIELGELLLHYQPQVEIKSGRIVGLEALVRWRHPRLGLVPPTRFIPVSEQTGLIVPVGEWVMRQACADLKQLQDMGINDVAVAVNLSAKQFSDSDVVGLVQDVIESTGIRPEQLDLEITESTLMNNPEHVIEYLHRLKALGIRLSIDDFGTGYSSLNYLKQFPVDTLKIDRSFVVEIAGNPKDEAIAVTIITLAHAMGMTALAEGVEENAQTKILLQHGCDIIQGFFYSRPLPFEEVLGYLKSGGAFPAHPEPKEPTAVH